MSILKVSCQNLTDVKKKKEVGGWGKKPREIEKVNFSLYFYGTFA